MKSRRIALIGLLVALALVLSYLESLVPLSFAIPGIKLGLPNLVIVFALYRLRWPTAAAISLLRVLLVALLFGSALSLAYSAAGAAFSLLVMCLLKRGQSPTISPRSPPPRCCWRQARWPGTSPSSASPARLPASVSVCSLRCW